MTSDSLYWGCIGVRGERGWSDWPLNIYPEYWHSPSKKVIKDCNRTEWTWIKYYGNYKRVNQYKAVE